MKRLTFTLTLALIAGGVTAAGGYAAQAANGLCVGSKPGCFATIQAAVDAANDGDTITIAPGTFAGGVAVYVSVDIRGAGAGATTISGGAPVLTLGKEFAPTEPTISINGVTITGGLNSSLRRSSSCLRGSAARATARSPPAAASSTRALSLSSMRASATTRPVPSARSPSSHAPEAS